MLSSYTTGRFLHFKRFPLIPVGRNHIVDECPYCGNRGITSNRKYKKQRTKDLAAMMEAFTAHPDYPDTALNGLHTLMVYNEESWFMDLVNSYGRRYYNHMQVQLVVAQGLCRFGQYDEAETYCRTAIVLGAGPRAEELLSLCQSLREKSSAKHLLTLGVQPASMLRPFAFVIAVAVLALTSIITVGLSSMRNHTAWLANGTALPYSVEIDGKSYPLKPHGIKRITLRLGKHRMATQGLPGQRDPVTFSYTSSLITQKLHAHALVLNPDAMAVLIKETVSAGQITNQYLFGNTVNALTGIDHAFAHSPARAASKRADQTRLNMLPPSSQLDAVELLRRHGGPDDVGIYARRALSIQPDGPETAVLLNIAIDGLPVNQAIAFLRHGAEAEPISIGWNLFYQDFMKKHRPEHDLQTEYALRCEARPDVSEYYYLLARIAKNREAEKLLYGRSEQGEGVGGKGYQAIAYDLFCSGEFSDAFPYSDKALARDPENREFKRLNTWILLAMDKYEALLPPLREALSADPHNGKAAAQLVHCLTVLGEHRQADKTVASFKPAAGEGTIDWNAYFNAIRFLAAGNTTDYLACLAASGDPSAPLQTLLHTGKILEAEALLGANGKSPRATHLVLYCAAKYHGFPEIAETHWTQAFAEPEDPSVGSLPAYAAAPSVQQLLDLHLDPQDKAILCAALGLRFPEQRDAFFRLSAKFNFVPEHPQLLLKQWTRPARQPQ